MIRGRQCHVFVNCHNRSPSRRRHTMSVRLGTSGLSCLDRFGSTSSNKYQCFFFFTNMDERRLPWRRRQAGDGQARGGAAAPSFINVHHLNVIRHPVALVRVDTIRLELKLLVKGPSKKDVEAMYFERMMFFSLDHLVTINQILNTKCQLKNFAVV